MSNKDHDRQLIEEEISNQKEYIKKIRTIINNKKEILGRSLSACVVTFGCQMNERDSEKLKGILVECGYVLTDSEDADFLLFNTCTVRENANTRFYGHLGHVAAKKKKNKEMLVCVCGCMPQESDELEKLKSMKKGVDLVFGTFNVYKFAELLYERLCIDSQVNDVWEDNDKFVELLPTQRKYSFKSGVNIMYGCDNFCTYCIVPYVRGREKSRPVEDIVEEVRKLSDDGVVEVMLLGQNVNSYGKGLSENVNFCSLLKEIEKIEKIKRIRFMTPHPKDLSDELIDYIAASEKVCNHVHLPLQSGSSEILKKMNRKYTKEEYLNLVDKIRGKIKDVSITTDIIVGFPGETDEDFEETVDVVRKAEFESAYTFIYSKRSNTPAASMGGEVPKEVVDARFKRLLSEIKNTSERQSGYLVGTVAQVLVESLSESDSSYVTGRLTNNVLVHFKGNKDLIGKIVTVKITESKGFYYFGEIN